METLIYIALAFWLGWKACEIWSAYVFKEILKDLGVTQDQLTASIKDKEQRLGINEPEEDTAPPELEVRVEQHPEGLFAYRKRDGFFLARGSDREELMANLVHNLNNVRVTVHKEDGAELIAPPVK